MAKILRHGDHYGRQLAEQLTLAHINPTRNLFRFEGNEKHAVEEEQLLNPVLFVIRKKGNKADAQEKC